MNCPWCGELVETEHPRLALVTANGRRRERIKCAKCGGGAVLLWEGERLSEVRRAPQPKLRWEPTYDGPADGRTRE